MGKIMNLVREHFSDGVRPDSFSALDFEKATGVNSKVASMNLKRLASSERLGCYMGGGGQIKTAMYIYRTPEQINRAVADQNLLVDKYDLKKKKLKPIETK